MLYKYSATQLKEAFLQGKFSAVHITTYFLERIKSLNPSVKAFLEVYYKEAILAAERLDEKKKSGQPLGSLAAIPVAIKDNIHVFGQKTTAGSRFLEEYKAIFQATVIDKLLAEDAILIGKTNMDEFAMGSSTENSYFGPSYNPWDLTRVPGGSSGGSCAAVAAGMAPLALGSDTGGSIRQPASFCGIVGMKPTYGSVSRWGLIAFASSLDQIGPIARSTEDAALLLNAITGHDPKDATSLQDPTPNYTELSFDLQGKKIGLPLDLISDLEPSTKKIFDLFLEKARLKGAEIIPIELPLHKYALDIYYILAPAEASANLARYDGVSFSKRAEKVKDLFHLYTQSRKEGFGSEVKRRILIGTFVLSSGHKEAYYQKALKARSMIASEYKQAFAKVDLIALPTCPTPAFSLGAIKTPLEMYLNDIFTIPVNLAGLPAISIPAGLSEEGLPIGCQLIAPQKEDLLLLQAAHCLETPELKDKVAPMMDREV